MPSTDRAARPAAAEGAGLLILDDFLDPATCAGLCADIDRAPPTQATLIRKDRGRLTDPEVRRTQRARVPARAATVVERRLAALAPVLTVHFGSRLSRPLMLSALPPACGVRRAAARPGLARSGRGSR